MSFAEVHAAHPWDEVLGSVVAKTEADVLRALARAEADSADLEDFKALISPAAAPHLERMARLSHERTLRRYGRTMQLFAPAYLSNECQNVCTYCGFSAGNKVPRRTLNPGEILREAGALKKLGFDHLLILTGESNKVEVPYFVQALDLLRPHFSSLSMEVQPMETAEYAELRKHGLNAVLVYQETYHRETYNVHHPKGRKSDFAYRLDAPDRVGAAGDAQAMQVARHRIAEVFTQVDVLLTPTAPGLPEPINGAQLAEANSAEASTRNTAPFNLYGIPTVSIPCGFSASGLPIGLQISSARLDEASLLALASAWQRDTDWHQRRPALA